MILPPEYAPHRPDLVLRSFLYLTFPDDRTVLSKLFPNLMLAHAYARSKHLNAQPLSGAVIMREASRWTQIDAHLAPVKEHLSSRAALPLRLRRLGLNVKFDPLPAWQYAPAFALARLTGQASGNRDVTTALVVRCTTQGLFCIAGRPPAHLGHVPAYILDERSKGNAPS